MARYLSVTLVAAATIFVGLTVIGRKAGHPTDERAEGETPGEQKEQPV